MKKLFTKTNLRKLDTYALLYPVFISVFLMSVSWYHNPSFYNLWYLLVNPIFYLLVLIMPRPKNKKLLKNLEDRMNEAAGLASPHRERMMWLIAKRNSNDCGGASIVDPDNAEFWKYEMLRWNNLQEEYRKDYIKLTINERN